MDKLDTKCNMIKLSLSKIRELHGSFKSICDTFAINLTEFETIFASDEKTFAIFDNDNNGKSRTYQANSSDVVLCRVD